MRFFNPARRGPKGPARFLRWQLTDRGAAWPRSSRAPTRRSAARPRRGRGSPPRLRGHASFLVQIRGHERSDRPGLVEFAGPSRLRLPEAGEPARHRLRCPASRSTPYSSRHNHYDHMDVGHHRASAAALSPRVSSRHSAMMRSCMRRSRAGRRTAATGARCRLGSESLVHAEPSQHWSARGVRDRSHALWASFVRSVQACASSTAPATPASAMAPSSPA